MAIQSETIYHELARVAGYAPEKRFLSLCALHSEMLSHYLPALEAITPERALMPVSETDKRNLAQVVAHILEWDRYMITSMAEVVAFVPVPGMMTRLRYAERDGRTFAYQTIDEFNARIDEKYAAVPWYEIKPLAAQAATALHTLFTKSGLLTPEALDKTKIVTWTLAKDLDMKVTIPCGWMLWGITIEHIIGEHVNDLGINLSV